MRIPRTIFAIALVLGVIFCFSGPGYSQGTNSGVLRGTVTDPNGAVIPNATVKITDQTTGLSRDLTTDGDGNYEAAALKPGTYKVSVSAAGFKTAEVDAVIKGADVVRADVRTEVGAQSENVLISGAEAGIIEKDQPVISGTLNNRQLIEIPRDSRDIYEFLYLNPDITQGPNGDGSFKFIGGQSYGASFSLDSQRTNGGIFGEPTGSQPSLETIGELTVLSKNFTAEYSGIANIRVETKRGGRDYHGSLFYNNKNDALAAWTVQDKNAQAAFLGTADTPTFPKSRFNLNEAGGYLSGRLPLTDDKTFFLLSYERRWDLNVAQLRSSQVPTSPLLNGNFTTIATNSRPTVNAAVLPLLTAQELADNTIVTNGTRRWLRIPSRLLNPIALGVMNGYYPNVNPATPFNASNGRLRSFVRNVPGLLTRDLATFRLDHDFSERNKFFAVYNFQDNPGNRRSLAVNPLPAFGLLSQHQTNHTLSLSFTHLFSNTIVNETRGGFNVQNLFRRDNQSNRDFLSSIGFNDSEITTIGSVLGADLLDTAGPTRFTFAPFTGIGNGGRSINRSLDQHLVTFGDTVTWTRGDHSIKAGADFVRNQAVDGFSATRGNPRGFVNYGTSFTSYANFLLGLPPNSVTFVGATRRGDLNVSNWEDGFFVQDDYKIRPSVTLNLGLRYELITPFVEKDDLMVNFDPTTSVNPGFQGRFIIPSDKTLALLDPRFVAYGVVTADQAGVGRGLVKTDRNNFAPRVGIAWRLGEKNVVRAGYGIYYPTSAAQGMRDALATNAFNQSVTKRGTQGLPGGINPRGITPFSGGTISVGDPTDFTALAANAIPFDLQSPRFEQFNVTFERELRGNLGVRVSYVGTRQHNLIAGRDLNELPPNNIPFGIHNENGDLCDPIDEVDCTILPADAARRPFPRLGDFLATYGNTGKGRSHALQFEVNRRFARGLIFNASYTLLDQKSSGTDVGNSSLGGTLYNQFAPDVDFSRDSFVSRHRFVSYGSYELPIGRNRPYGKSMSKWAEGVVGGWDLSWNMFAKSGTGFTPFWVCNSCGNFGFLGPGNVGSGFIDAVGDFSSNTYRPTVVSDPYANLTGDQVFNPAAFGLPPLGADLFDNPAIAKRNFLTGPGTWGVNLGVRKYFRFSETTRLEVGADFNNVFNHPLFSPLDTFFANVGDFDVAVTPAGQLEIVNVNLNPDFGRNNISFSQEGIDNRRSVRVRLRLSF
ncbi:MAG TPA: TonB-dependent receptor [Pyrinomonadaceae bacterium]|nr:TonB-dependent receptor [Pyrinomonadaceae bacterium]